DSLLQQTLTKVENFWMADPVQHGKPDYTLRYNTQTIPSVQNLAFADVAINSNVSLASDTDPEGGNYIVGLQKTSETGGKLYIGLTTDGLNLTWLRKPNIKGLREVSAVSIQALRKGCVILVQGKWTGSDIQANVFVRFDEFGNEQVQTPMQSSARPCFLYYDDINETILSAYKGKNAQSVSSDTLQVYMNKTDGTPIWAQQYPLQGTLAGISRMDKQYIFFFNFTKYRGLNGDLQTKANGSNLLAVFVPDNGIETQAPVTIGAEQAFEISRVEKLNSSTICVLGHTGTNKKMVYMLLNAEGKLQYSNL
ncbi:MAG: hypothetical protein RIS47_1829, partial [Bacteroidota bacterium]